MWAAIINIVPVESESKPLWKQTIRILRNRCEQLYHFSERREAKEVFIFPLPSTMFTWGNLGDKRGSQSSGSEKRTQESLSVCEPGSQVSPARDSRCTAVLTWGRVLMMETCCSKPSQPENALTIGRVLPLWGSGCLLIMLITREGQLFRHWWMMEIITSLLPHPHSC